MLSPIIENYKNTITTLNNVYRNSQEAIKLKQTLTEIINATDVFFKRGDDGLYKVFTEDSRKTISNLYLKAALYCQNLIDSEPQNEYMKSISEKLSKDITFFNLLDIDAYTNLPRAFDKAGVKKVDITGAALVKAGEALSSRKPMTVKDENGREIKGFFTPETKFDPLGDWLAVLDKHINKAGGPEKTAPMNEFWDRFTAYVNGLPERAGKEPLKRDNSELFGYFGDLFLSDEMKENNADKPFERLYYIMKHKVGMDVPEIGHLHNLPEQKDQITSFERALFNSSSAIYGLVASYMVNARELGIHVGDNIDKRNSAMTAVAGLLNVPNLIVKAVPMTVVNNGVETNGTFLPNAEGLDIKRPNLSNPNITGNAENFKNTNAYKDLADLQVLDYICGNIDRHVGNMLYKFDENGKFTGVQGIDNDCSFGLSIPEEGQRVKALPSLYSFHFVSKSMAETLKGIKPAQLKVTLAAQGLHPTEIEAACTRLSKVQQTITYGTMHYAGHKNDPMTKLTDYIRVIDDDQFKNIDFTSDKMYRDLQNRSASFLAYGRYLMDEIAVLRDPSKPHKKANAFVQPEVREIRVSDELAMTQKANEYSEKLNALKAVDCWFIPSSTEFKHMRVSLEKLSMLSNEYKGRPLDQAGYEKFEKELSIMGENVSGYIKMKSAEEGRSDYANSRLDYANKLKEFIIERKRELLTRVKGEVVSREDRKADARALLDGFKREMEANGNKFTSKLAGKAIKIANEATKLIAVRDKMARECEKLAANAIKYLKKTPGSVEASGLSQQELSDAEGTVRKGMQSAGYSKEKEEAKMKEFTLPQ